MLTRKHFRAAAELVRELMPEHRVIMANQYVKLFASQNPRFDRAKFLKACGLENEND